MAVLLTAHCAGGNRGTGGELLGRWFSFPSQRCPLFLVFSIPLICLQNLLPHPRFVFLLYSVPFLPSLSLLCSSLLPPLLFLFLLFCPGVTPLKNKLPFSVFCSSVDLPCLLSQIVPPFSIFFFFFFPPCSVRFSAPKILPLVSFSLPLFISRKRGSSPLLCPIVVQGGAGLCRVRWPPVCKHGASVSSIIVAGYGLY